MEIPRSIQKPFGHGPVQPAPGEVEVQTRWPPESFLTSAILWFVIGSFFSVSVLKVLKVWQHWKREVLQFSCNAVSGLALRAALRCSCVLTNKAK